MVLKKKINAKIKDLTSKSLVDNNAEGVEAIKYVALCMETAEQEYRHLSNRHTDNRHS